jgi:hypothetical protein
MTEKKFREKFQVPGSRLKETTEAFCLQLGTWDSGTWNYFLVRMKDGRRLVYDDRRVISCG